MVSTFNEVVHFGAGKQFFRGNLHCHSTTSDGSFSYQELIKRYKAHGYNFLCLSEHEEFTDRTELNSEGFITLPTVEWATHSTKYVRGGQTHHIHGVLGTSEMVKASEMGAFKHGEMMPSMPFEGIDSVYKMRDYLAAHGCLVIYNHPLWSRTAPRDFGLLDGFLAMEIQNRGCELEDFTAFAEVYWDDLLRDGSKVFAVATDDNHNRTTVPDDSFGGWVMVWADELTHDGVTQALRDGEFYSSTGPEIFEYGIKDGVCYVECSPCYQVNFVCGGEIGAGSSVWSDKDGNTVTRAEHRISGREDYIRIRCQDARGKVAWTNPLFASSLA